jgi:capsular polysaccharide export protein
MNATAFIAHSPAILNLPGLSALLHAPILPAKSLAGYGSGQVVVGWGKKPSAREAVQFADRHGLPFWRLEDGFLRSVGLGSNDPPLSIVVDDLGIYYDATASSRLETLLQEGGWETPELLERAGLCMTAIVRGKLSKYNHAPPLQTPLPGNHPNKVLLIDQTYGDSSIAYGLADADTFARMLSAALEENPEADIIIKTHPDVVAGKKRGYLCHLKPADPRVFILAADLNPLTVLEQVDRVYAVTSQMGFEALLLGKPVDCFGMPFYAGWGVTSDRQSCPRRTRSRTLAELFAAAYILYPRYIDPETGQPCEIERLIEWLTLQRQMRGRFPAELYAIGFSRWKKRIVRDFFQGSHVRFVNRADQVPAGNLLATWGHKPIRGRLADKVALIRLEDGFLRSVGLGADLVRPLSWVMDRQGIYYDATAPSDLESLLQQTAFPEELQNRARSLREELCQSGLTKYNVGAGHWQRPVGVARVILVPGQVESDASIRYGAPGIRTNLGLLKAVRAANPDAYVIYKPHPDVVAGLRAKGSGEGEAFNCCDEIITNVPMGPLLEVIDEVHTLTSLAGFEALLRGKQVVAYGQPFYAGWGLTRDMIPPLRRQRKLALDELVAGVIISYPTYVSRTTGRFTTPERAFQELLAWRDEGPTRLPLWRRGWRLLMRFRGK